MFPGKRAGCCEADGDWQQLVLRLPSLRSDSGGDLVYLRRVMDEWTNKMDSSRFEILAGPWAVRSGMAKVADPPGGSIF